MKFGIAVKLFLLVNAVKLHLFSFITFWTCSEAVWAVFTMAFCLKGKAMVMLPPVSPGGYLNSGRLRDNMQSLQLD